MNRELLNMLKDYLRIVREHYYYDTDLEKKEYIKSIKKQIDLLKD
jgi:hypothetical protein